MAAAKRPVPTFEDWLAAVPRESAAVIAALDAMALGYASVAREVHWDGLARDFTPSYKLGGRELFHVHPSDGGGAGITFSVSVAKLEPRIASEVSIDDALRRRVLAAKAYRGTRWAFLDCPTTADAARLEPLVRCKVNWIAGGAA